MYLRPQTSENPYLNPAVRSPTEGAPQSPQQPYATPMFEASPGIQAQTAQAAPPQTEQATPGMVSPFQLQPGTFEQRFPNVGRSPAPGIQQPQTSPASVSPASFQQPLAIPWTTAASQRVPSTTPASHTPQAGRSTPGTVQQPFFQATQPQAQALQSPGTLGSRPGELGRPSPRQPPMDIHDAGDELEIDIELPGVSKKDIRLAGHEQGLSLRAVAKERETEDLVTSERGERVFQRDIPLGFAVDPEEVEARFQNGVLIVTVPNKAAKGLGAIEIK